MLATSRPAGDTPAGRNRQIELLYALNEAAASLQRAARSEEEVFAVFREQIGGLGLYGFLALKDESGERLVFRAVAYAPDRLERLERLTGMRAEGFAFDPQRVDCYRQVLQTGQSLFIPDARIPLTQMMPPVLRPLLERISQIVGTRAGILVPFIGNGTVQGVMSVSGPDLTPDDVPAVEAFSNHLAVALENARLFHALQHSERMLT
ncbi:MAG: GAF domain-containing protein, partial [Caldilineae bacterium]